MSYTVVIQQNVYIDIKLVVATTFYSRLLLFLCSLFSIKNEYISGFNPINSSIATPPVSSFIYPVTSLFESSWYFDLVK